MGSLQAGSAAAATLRCDRLAPASQHDRVPSISISRPRLCFIPRSHHLRPLYKGQHRPAEEPETGARSVTDCSSGSMGDFFADLLPKQVPHNATQQPPTFEDDVLVSPKAGAEGATTRASSTPPMAGHPMVSVWSVLDARDRAARHPSAHPNPAMLTPLPLQRKDSSKDLEGAVQQVFQKFSGSLQKILEDIDRCGPRRGRGGSRQRVAAV